MPKIRQSDTRKRRQAIFSGIVEEVGTIVSVSQKADGSSFRVSAKLVTNGLKLGDSISVNGTCLTAVEFASNWFDVEAVAETLRRTKLGALKVGDAVNLEAAMRLGDRVGGHLVSGHIDSTAQVSAIKQEGFSRLISFQLDGQYAPLFIEKGSVAIDGVSLTVASADKNSGENKFTFTVALIPHTLEVTTLGALKIGDAVNIECDLMGKYVASMLAPMLSGNSNKQAMTLSFLAEHGYV